MDEQEDIDHTTETHENAARSALRAMMDDPSKWAIFLDIDGTLLDLALSPEAVAVPAGLADVLNRLSARLGGALALVTGRSLGFVDQLFQPFSFPVAGLHGADIRAADGSVSLAGITPEFEGLKEALAEEMLAMPGVLVEDKGAAVAAHYRLAPDYRDVVEERMRHYAEMAGSGWALQLGKMVFEIRPARSSKGDAVQFFLQQPPFAGRLPMTIGDDLTDESMFAVANARGGYSIRVGQRSEPTSALSQARTPDFVRAMLKEMADRP